MSDNIKLQDIIDLDFDCPRAGVYGRALLEAPPNPEPGKERLASYVILNLANEEACVTYQGYGSNLPEALWALWADMTLEEPPFTDDALEAEIEKVCEKLREGVIKKLFPTIDRPPM